MRTAVRGLIVAALIGALIGSTALAVTPTKVIDAPDVNESSGVRNDGWFGWTSDATGENRAWLNPAGPAPARRIRGDYPAYLGDVVLDGPSRGRGRLLPIRGVRRGERSDQVLRPRHA